MKLFHSLVKDNKIAPDRSLPNKKPGALGPWTNRQSKTPSKLLQIIKIYNKY